MTINLHKSFISCKGVLLFVFFYYLN